MFAGIGANAVDAVARSDEVCSVEAVEDMAAPVEAFRDAAAG